MANIAALALSELPQPSKVIAGCLEKLTSTSKRSHDTIPFHCSVALAYEHLKDGTAIKEMDDQLILTIAVTTKTLSTLVQEAKRNNNRSIEWSEIISAMAQNPSLEPFEDPIERNDKLIKSGTHFFKFDGSPDPAIVKEVETWFGNLIDDEDVHHDTKINIDVLAAIVAETGARVTDPFTLFHKHSLVEYTVLDIGVLRYPDIDNPFFKVYRIKLTAWAECDRTLFEQHDSNGIKGTYNCRKYKPRASVLASISEHIKEKAKQEVEDMFK